MFCSYTVEKKPSIKLRMKIAFMRPVGAVAWHSFGLFLLTAGYLMVGNYLSTATEGKRNSENIYFLTLFQGKSPV